MISKLAVHLYALFHKTLRIRGGGALLRAALPLAPGLRNFPLHVPSVGTARIDFRDGAAYSLLNFTLGDFGDDRNLLPLIDRCLSPDGVLWDVGANVGIVSAFCAQRKQGLASIHAFEPNPKALRVLHSLFSESAKVTVHDFALGSENSELPMNCDAKNSHLGSLVHSPLQNALQSMVKVRRADDLCEEDKIPPPTVVKIDVEGFEPNVFAGMSGTIAKHRPIIFFEHLWLKEEVVRSLVPDGYTLWFIDDSGKIHADYARKGGGHDAWLLPAVKDHLKPEL